MPLGRDRFVDRVREAAGTGEQGTDSQAPVGRLVEGRYGLARVVRTGFGRFPGRGP